MDSHQLTMLLAYSSMRDINAWIVLKAWVRTDLHMLVQLSKYILSLINTHFSLSINTKEMAGTMREEHSWIS